MPEYTDEETFLRLVIEQLKKSGIEIDEESGNVTGYLSDVVFAVLDTYSQHGPVMFGD